MSMHSHNSRDEIKSFIDRILRLKEEQDAISEDIREVYSEAKSRGWNKTALGQAVTAVRKRQKDREGFDALEADTEMYLHAYYGATESEHPHTRARETDPASPGDAAPERGEAVEGQPVASPASEDDDGDDIFGTGLAAAE